MNTKPFSFKLSGEPPFIKISFHGSLVQQEQLPMHPTAEKLNLDLGDCTYINSIGLGQFIKWIQEHSQASVALTNVPATFMRQMAALKNFKSKNVIIDSCYLPYFSDNLGETTQVILKNGVDYTYGGDVKIPQVKDSAGDVMEVDVDIRSYFAFLKG